MKKTFPYLVGAVVVVLLVVFVASRSGSSRRLDERITLKQKDKIPYGTRVAKDLLSSLFPKATVFYDVTYPGNWDSIDIKGTNQAVILVSDYLDVDMGELRDLAEFVDRGNYVFIISRTGSDDVANFFGFTYQSAYSSQFSSASWSDSLQINLESAVFKTDSFYSYPGRKYEGAFYSVNTGHTAVLGKNKLGYPNFIQMNKGAGSFFIHAAPLAFSNYFILHKNNIAYYEQALAVLPKEVDAILWNEYYLEKPRNPSDKDDPDWLAALFSYPAFKWGLLLGAFTLALYVLLGMRRSQRMIPPFEKPKNDSLDFVKTLGRLYYDRKDHKNLAGKMAAYFLEHVRSNYKLPTHVLDEGFLQSLHFKSGYPLEEIKRLVMTIQNLQGLPSISDEQLSDLHKQLELFYQNT